MLPFHCQPRIYEPCVQDAKVYTELALERNGPLPVPPPVPFDYPWGTALEVNGQGSSVALGFTGPAGLVWSDPSSAQPENLLFGQSCYIGSTPLPCWPRHPVAHRTSGRASQTCF